MKPWLKVAVVAGGYIAAILVPMAAVAVRVANPQGPDAQAASGMYAFGDLLVFISVFGVVAIVPTAAALFFLRPYRRFWRLLAAFSVGVAVTGVTAAAVFAIDRHAAAPSPIATWAALSVLRILVAPLLALAFLVCTVLAPYRLPRLAFIAVTVTEVAVSAYGG